MKEAGILLQLRSPGGLRYLSLGPRELDGLAAALEWALRSAGVGSGDLLMVYDLSSALEVLPLTRAYAPGLGSGACERIGCSVISMDGLPSLATRTAYFYRLLRPRFLLVRDELLAPLRARLGRDGLRSNEGLRALIIASRGPVPPADVPFLSLRVVEEALFIGLASEGGLSYPSDLYEVRCDGGILRARPRFSSGVDFSPVGECATAEVAS